MRRGRSKLVKKHDKDMPGVRRGRSKLVKKHDKDMPGEGEAAPVFPVFLGL